MSMSKKDTFKDISPTPLEVEVEPPSPILDEAALENLDGGFGKGISARKMLVTKGVTLKQLVEAVDD